MKSRVERWQGPGLKAFQAPELLAHGCAPPSRPAAGLTDREMRWAQALGLYGGLNPNYSSKWAAKAFSQIKKKKTIVLRF